jgi:hypothetical protein
MDFTPLFTPIEHVISQNSEVTFLYKPVPQYVNEELLEFDTEIPFQRDQYSLSSNTPMALSPVLVTKMISVGTQTEDIPEVKSSINEPKKKKKNNR